MAPAKQQAPIVLVHGACHGAWSWYKLKPLLEEAGHRVTALDLSASGVDLTKLHDLRTFADYTQPLLRLLASIPPEEKVVLVGHSLGGMNLGLAMEMYPDKISVAVFLAAFMPDSKHSPSYVLEQYMERTPKEEWLDTEFVPFGAPEDNLTSMFFGPKFLSTKLYNLCSPQDLALAKMLLRPSSLFVEDLARGRPFSEERFGSVKRVNIVCGEDKGIPVNFQRWQIENSGVAQVREIKHADHMAMLSTPKELCQCLLEIANDHA